MIVACWKRLWKVQCIYVFFLGYFSIWHVFMDVQTSINTLISFPIKMIYCIILIFVICYSHNILPMGLSSALKRKWKVIDKRNWNWNWWKGIGIGIGIAIFYIKWIGIGIGIERKGIGIGIELRKRNWPQPWHLAKNIRCGAVITRWIFTQDLTKDPTPSSTVRPRYGVYFVNITCIYTVRCVKTRSIFSQIPYKRQPEARAIGRGKGCILCYIDPA